MRMNVKVGFPANLVKLHLMAALYSDGGPLELKRVAESLAPGLDLKPGQHTVRAAYVFDARGVQDGEPVRAVSQPVMIVTPPKPK